MNKQLRKAVIAGNWKMNNTPAETTALINEMKPLVADADCDVIICAPFVDLQAALDAAAGSNIQIGAENCHWAASGAFTGEVSAPMLAAMGVPYVIIGYMTVSFPEFMGSLYGNVAGTGVMTVCLLIYVGAYYLGLKIIRIEV